MELGPVPKIGTRYTLTSKRKKNDNDIMSANCDVIVFFLNYGKFATIPKPDSGHMVSKIEIFINGNLAEPENSTKKSLTQLLYYCFD